jgi:benzylsuccinate CoA-transferase BbsF subunit
VSCRDDAEWRRLATVVGAAGHTARADGDRVVAQWAATVSADAAQELLQAAGVPAGVVQDAGDLMADPQLTARSMWHRCDHGVFGERPFDRFPALWSAMELAPYLPPPSYVGEHNFEVFEELADMDVGEIAEGMADGLFS